MTEFREWILHVYPGITDDPVTHLAYEIRNDPTFPPGNVSYDELIMYLDSQNAPGEALDAAEQAWDRYLEHLNGGPE